MLPNHKVSLNRGRGRTGRWTNLAAAVTLTLLQGQERTHMEGLAIATFPAEPAAISGESLPFRTVMENRGAAPLQVPSPNSPSQFAYELRPQREGGPVYNISADERNRRRAVHRPIPVEIQYVTLDPGRRIERIEDLADFLDEGIQPAKYLVTAVYPAAGATSPKAVVTLLPAQVESLSSAVSGSSLVSAMAHRREDGGVSLLQRESSTDPREAVFYRRQSLPAGGPVAVAVAIDVGPAGSGRWFAWLRDRKLTASVGWGNRTILTSEPAGVDASQPELLSPGFELAVGTALFGVIDRKGDAVQLITYLAANSGLKRHWAASLTSSGAAIVQWNCQPDGSVTVVWEEPASGRLLSREFRPDGRANDDAPRVRSNSRLAAWSVVPSGPFAVSALGAFQGSYRYVRLGAGAGADPGAIAPLPGASAWGFCPSADGVIIVAATGEGISQTTPGGAWHEVVKTKDPQRLHAFTIPGGASWVEWVERGYGIRRAKLP
jgi:hypothetical protein